MRKKTALALVAMLVALGGVSLLAYKWANRQRRDSSTGEADSVARAVPAGLGDLGTSAFTSEAPMPRSASTSASAAAPAVPRENPYAVVRDGICAQSNSPDQNDASRKKWETLLRDPFWQSIFSGVDPEKFQLVKTSLPLHRFVNYWKMENGQAIHWTGKQILIPAGTRVFTDEQGGMYLCACGNQMAAVLPPGKPGTALPPEEEPPVAYLVPPEPDPSPVTSLGLPAEPLTPMGPPVGATPPPYNVSEGSPPVPPIPPISAGGPSSPSNGPGPGTTPVPLNGPPVVPEPGTLSLVLIGLGASIVARRYRKRR